MSGGTSGSGPGNPGNGSNSIFSTITSAGGGGGGGGGGSCTWDPGSMQEVMVVQVEVVIAMECWWNR